MDFVACERIIPVSQMIALAWLAIRDRGVAIADRGAVVPGERLSKVLKKSTRNLRPPTAKMISFQESHSE